MRAQYHARSGRYPRLSAEGGGTTGFKAHYVDTPAIAPVPAIFLSLMQVFAYPQPSFVPAESSEVRRAERSAAGAKEAAMFFLEAVVH